MAHVEEATGVEAFPVVNTLIDKLEQHYPGIRTATYARALASLQNRTDNEAAAIRAHLSLLLRPY